MARRGDCRRESSRSLGCWPPIHLRVKPCVPPELHPRWVPASRGHQSVIANVLRPLSLADRACSSSPPSTKRLGNHVSEGHRSIPPLPSRGPLFFQQALLPSTGETDRQRRTRTSDRSPASALLIGRATLLGGRLFGL